MQSKEEIQESINQKKRNLYKKCLKLKQEQEENKNNKIIRYIKSKFHNQKMFKLFIVLQLFCIIILTIYDLTHYWDINDFNLNHWSSSRLIGNYILIATIFLPIFIAKSLDWILNTKE